MKKQFKKLLLEIARFPMQKQAELLDENLTIWKNKFDQTDDILVTGIKI